MYHAHLRPLTTPIATLQSLSASFHASPPFRLPLPLPATALRALASASSPNPLQTESTVSPTSLESIANALEIPPMHVDHVGQAICFAVERADVSGPVGVRGMRDLIGWKAEDADSPIAQRPTAGL